MNIDRHLRIEDYNYHLPLERIAQFPAGERDQSRLLIHRNGITTQAGFREIVEFIPGDSLLVFNNTRVIRARIIFSRPTGATIEIFCLEPGGEIKELQQAFARKGSAEWICLVGNVKRWKEGELVKTFVREGHPGKLVAQLVERLEDGCFLVRFLWEPAELTFPEILEVAGMVPLPPYIERASGDTDRERYQTIFAENNGSVAAPTAGLHFTPQILSSLEKKGVKKEKVTLHVGLGTFRPVSSPDIAGHVMHPEKIIVSRETIQNLIENKSPVTAVGTTTVRTLESLYWAGVKVLNGLDILEGIHQWDPYELEQETPREAALEKLLHYLDEQGLESFSAETRLIIIPGYTFRMTDILLTNFHQPQSTLLLLVAAFTGPGWKDAYHFAIENKFRFLSYGDACLFFRQS